ncbi:MAG: response regulator transcription factor [Alcanivorax sp.]|jgi:two-component system, OmpR family, response regulator|uniref:response regulator transcription factor n=1 Tax=Alloalcanivorax venustensis TaxID=172371 RepID=UPI000C376393|nr:DNA-binding response regulator [Alcanivorax sp.]MEC8880383.1 response regulator transcription factor [Pseudomonadota bacterium]MAQ33713.1 DNA-binding response regulator [Alcanivorax sp.]MBD3650538.1 response regulator transcription factor [Alcanivorax sp.]MBF48519.1 DNA-binding response regulator [Alcanivorax sp.]|tara:strand:+ start:5569 stop:6234 length:666 start_codon:yes stop_codon:yes gene_type:complete
MRLLLVEDTVALADQLLPLLRDHGYAVDWLADGRDALVRAHDDDFDLVILDLGLPGLDGLEVLRRWREQGLSMPVLILTARDSWAERVDGLRAGADDYLTKPFHPEELLLRVQAVLRRSHGSANQSRLRACGVELDEERQSAWLDQQEVELTGAEFRMLRYFMLNPGRLLSKIALSEHLYDGESERDSNVVEVHINRLRRKLGGQVIQTRRGQGYLFTGRG